MLEGEQSNLVITEVRSAKVPLFENDVRLKASGFFLARRAMREHRIAGVTA